jgi:peptidoglycan/xylan/chitin deacetylase (PgdA/CDA1 family)
VIPRAVAMFNMSDGTTKYFGMPNPQPNGTSDWQFYSETFQVPLGTKSVSAFLFVSSNGYVQVDDQALASYQPTGFNRPLVTLTFDDGYEENVTNALPILDQYGFKTTQCFETADIQSGGNDAKDNVLAFKNGGHEICSHTITHPYLTKISSSQLTQELSQSQTYLQNLIGGSVPNFASPFGDYNAAVNTEIKKYYRSHRTVDEGYNSKDNFDAYRLRVQNMTPTTTLAQVQAWIAQAQADHTWLILVYHKIDSANLDPFDTYTSEFAKQMKAIYDSGITVKTMSAALDEVTAQL